MSMLILLGLGLAMASMMIGGGSDVPSDDLDEALLAEEPDEPETPEEQDIGATVLQNGDGSYSVELGEDETGSLVLVNYIDSEDLGTGLGEYFEQRLYLLPEDATIAEGDIDQGVPWSDMTLAQLEQQLGLQTLAVWDLGSITPIDDEPYVQDNRIDAPVIQADAPIAVYDVIAQTDGDEILSIRPEDYVPPPPTYNGAVIQPVSADTTGTEAPDWLVAEADGITLSGQGGDDRLDANAGQVTLRGGDGDDQINISAPGAIAYGDAGNDQFTVVADATVYGGTGDDGLSSYGSQTSATLYGEAGNDNLIVLSTGSTAFGGAGDDFVSIGNDATGHGGAGNDQLQLDPGGTAHGGPGDDFFSVWNFYNSEDGPAIATGGEGADTFDLRPRNPYGESDEPYLRITDFDPDEDVLQLGTFSTPSAEISRVTLNEGGGSAYTDLEIHFRISPEGPPVEPGVAVVRLEGVSGITLNDLSIVYV
ncbi:calcium-binding protein [Tropicibacter oceani]|uniref:Calcium-binding protein n=1 Tax=Tropicibacter oceani TaxID=3058420 RepID=A0ABY8QJR1_9RHOB|nr:calcium-binding protein [Tropicibacter oceani]WGW04794.1 calcium-binding protein [Tropicibacter oceani]